MRFIKWIIKAIFGLILFLFLLVTIPIALMYKNLTPPEVSSVGDFNITEVIDEQLERLVSTDTNEVGVYISQDYINNLILKTVTEMMSENLSDEVDFLLNYSDTVMVKGVWVELKDKRIEVNVSLHIRYRDFTFKTSILIAIEIDKIVDDEIILKVKKINIGNLPVKWLTRVVPEVLAMISGESSDDFLAGAFEGIGTLNTKRSEIRINIMELIGNDTEDDSFMYQLMDLVSINGLIDITVKKHENQYHFSIVANLEELRTNLDIPILNEKDKISSESELSTFMQSKALAGLLNQSILLSETDLTKLIDYMFNTNGTLETEYLVRQEVYNGYEVILNTPYFIVNEKAYINIPFEFGKEGKYFKSNIKIETSFSKQDKDLNISFNEISFGNLNISSEILDSILGTIDLGEISLNSKSFVVKDFFSALSNEDEGMDIKIMNITIVNGNVSINFQKIERVEMLEDLLEQFPNLEVKDIASSLLDKIKNGEDLTESIDDLLDIYENLTSEEKDLLMDIAGKYFDFEKEWPLP